MAHHHEKPAAGSKNKRVIGLSTGLLRADQVKAAVLDRVKMLKERHGYVPKTTPYIEVAMITRVGREDLDGLIGFANVFCSDPGIVNAFYGCDFEGKSEKLIPVTPTSPVERSASEPTHSHSAPSTPAPVPASSSVSKLSQSVDQVYPVKGKPWWDDEEELPEEPPANFFDAPVPRSMPELRLAPAPVQPKPVPAPAPRYQSVPIEPMIKEFKWPLQNDQVQLATKYGDADPKNQLVRVTNIQAYELDGTFCHNILATFAPEGKMVPTEITREHVEMGFAPYVSDHTKEISVKIGGQVVRGTAPIVREVFPPNFGGRRTILVVFDPDSDDAEVALAMRRQFRVDIRGATHTAVFINAKKWLLGGEGRTGNSRSPEPRTPEQGRRAGRGRPRNSP